MDRDSGMPSSAVSQLEDWLASQEEETRRLKVTETINHATLDAAGVTSKLDGPASLGRLPRLDLGDDEAELRTVQLLGKGGMAEVHLARQRALRRDVAIKRLPRGKDSTQAATSLLREARVTGRLEHPNIVPVHMLGCDQAGMPVIVMKRVEGLRWRDLVGNLDPSSWQTTKVWSQEPIMRHLEVLIEVCNAVHFAHSMGVVHRDIKPSNVMVGRFGEVYLLDWGVATEAGSEAFAHAVDGQPCMPLGTPAYMAPEMVYLEGIIDERTDVYQLGACLHEALVGKPPHPQEDLVAVLQSVLASEPFAYDNAVPPELAAICRRAMARDPNERFGSALELREALTHFMSHRGSLRLVREADTRLATLIAKIHDPRRTGWTEDEIQTLRKLFTECRFAFKQALREWPESAAAQQGLTESVEAMTRFELDFGRPEAAQILLEELDNPSPELAAAVAEARERSEEAHRDLDRLKFDLDVRVSLRTRMIVSFILAVAIAVLGTLFLPIGQHPLLRRSNWTILLAYVLFGAIMSSVVLVTRHNLLRNAANRRLMMTMVWGVLGMIGTRAIAGVAGLDLQDAASIDLVICGAVCGMAASTIHPWVGTLAAVYALGALAVQVLPAGAGTTLGFSGTQAAAFVLAGYIWRLRKVSDPTEPSA